MPQQYGRNVSGIEPLRKRPDRPGPGPETAAVRLLCDEMLHRLARFLRAAGYDTALAADGQADGDILTLALAEGRVVLTRDQRLRSAAGAGVTIIRLSGESLDHWALELRERLGIDWLFAPFTRCLVDNSLLCVAAEEALSRVPPKARELGGAVTACPACGRVYWPGSHVRRMTARLERWRRGRSSAGDSPKSTIK